MDPEDASGRESTLPDTDVEIDTGIAIGIEHGNGSGEPAVLVESAEPERGVAARATAVVVTRGRSEFLHETLKAVAAQSLTPVRTVVVDVASERTPGLLAGAADLGVSEVHAPHAHTFGAAITAALASLELASGDGAEQGAQDQGDHKDQQWLWLLHDDSAPEPGALAALKRAVEHKPSVVIAGAKQRDWFEPSRLIEVGLTTSPAGRRMTGIELGEVDQGQHDGREDVFAVGLAGALFRVDAWRSLRGTDPEYGLFGDGLEVSRRARLAGYRVIVVPDAAVRHAQRSFNALAPAREGAESASSDDGTDVAAEASPESGPRFRSERERSYGARRRSALLFRLVSASPLGVPFHMMAMVLLAPLRALWQVTLKRPGRARYELTAVAWAVLRPVALWRSRSLARRTAQVPRRALQPLRASWRDVWAERRDLRLARAEIRRTTATPDPLDRADRRREFGRRMAALGGVTAGLVAVSVWWFGSLAGALSDGGRLISPSLLLGQDSGVQLWRVVTGGWSAGGFGEAVPADPLVTVLLPFAFLGSSGLQLVIHSVVLGSIVFGGVGAWFAAGTATSSLALRAWAAFAWVVLPMGVLGVAQGRFGSILAHMTLPWLVFGALRAVGVRRPLLERVSPQTAGPIIGSGSIPAAAGAGLAFAVVVGGAPVLFVPVLLVLALIALLVRRRSGERSYRRNLLLVVVPALIVLLPTLREAGRLGWAEYWRVFLASPGAPVPVDAAAGWQQLLGWPSEPQAWWSADGVWGYVLAAVPFALSGLVVLLAVGGLVRRGSVAAPIRGAWLVGAVGLAGALAVGLVVVERGPVAQVYAWSGPLLSLAYVGFVGAALLGLDGAASRAAEHSFGWRQSAIVLLTISAIVVTGVSGAQMVRMNDLTAADHEGLRVLADPVVPAVGQQIQGAPRQARILVLEVGHTQEGQNTTYQVMRGDGPQLVDAPTLAAVRALVEPDSDDSGDPDELLAQVAAQLVGGVDAGTGDLTELGIGAVLLTPSGSFAERTLVGNRLDTVPGLERIAESTSGVIWRVAVELDETGLPAGLTSDDPNFDVQPAWARLILAGDNSMASAADETAAAPAQLGVLVPSSDHRINVGIPPGDSARTLVLAERADTGWQASLDGRRLRVLDNGWRQTFEVGADGGHLKVWHEPSGSLVWSVVLLSVLGLYLLLAVPVRRRAGAR